MRNRFSGVMMAVGIATLAAFLWLAVPPSSGQAPPPAPPVAGQFPPYRAPGVPRATYMPYAFQIVQGSSPYILMSYEFASATRTVRMNWKGDAPTDSWMGWSRGHWEKDTLVVDVTGQREQTWFDRAGDYHS